MGDEYVHIFPVWEWDKIPGTTTPAGEVENHNDWGVPGKTEFVGGAPDGIYGVMAYDMNGYGMQAHKAWFMFDNEVVCLEPGIESREMDKEINTSINQWLLVGDVFLISKSNAAKMTSESTVHQSYQGWIWHNKVGYYLPDSTAIRLKNETQTGCWSKINFNQPGEKVSIPIFNLCIEHGSKPQQANYAYYIVPGITSPASLKTYDTNGVEILSNSADLQAVHCKKRIYCKSCSIRRETRNTTIPL